MIRGWPLTETEICLLRSAMLATQTIVRGMEEARCDDKIEEISCNISEIAPELPDKTEDSDATTPVLLAGET